MMEKLNDTIILRVSKADRERIREKWTSWV